MPVVNLHNIPVHFPFEPYDVQKKYMEKVIQCLENGKNGMLESPTGTGKTLSLLCSTLAWRRSKVDQMKTPGSRLNELSNKDEDMLFFSDKSVLQTNEENLPPQIIYSSRTHTQLTQAIAELKRTQYTDISVAVLGSRDQLCIHPTVSTETNPGIKLSKCRAAVKNKSCKFQKNLESTACHPAFHEKILDIEDLVKVGQKLETCPYYMSRELKSVADIVFMPYNYILDPCTRKRQGINLKNNVVILDEGHNVEKMCEETASFELTASDIGACIAELSEIIDVFPVMTAYANVELPPFTADNLQYLRKTLRSLEKCVDEIPLNRYDDSAKFEGHYVFTLLGNAGISEENFAFLDGLLGRIIDWTNSNQSTPLQHIGSGLDQLQMFLNTVFLMDKCSFEEHKKSVSESFKVYVTLEKKMRRDTSFRIREEKPDAKVVNFWCFNPAFGMRALVREGVHSIILTSGTLSPLDALISELGIPVDITLESGHVIGNNQVYVGVLQSGPDGQTLNSSFRTRDDPNYIRSLGRSIQNASRFIPHGLLVFFPSYRVMEQCQAAWVAGGVWTQINKIKEIFVEPRSKRELKEVMEGYYRKIAEPGSNGACFMAVCRGKVSEGLDFIDYNGRGVIITGLPYPPCKEPRIVMKKEYLQQNKKQVTGQQWYQLEATRAVNQAIGRVIRHKDDYGVILFCDTRFSEQYIRKDLSSWLRNKVTINPGYGPLARHLSTFFKNAKEMLPQPEIKPMAPACSDSSDDDDYNSTHGDHSTGSTSTIQSVYDAFNNLNRVNWRDKLKRIQRGGAPFAKRHRNSPVIDYENMPTLPVNDSLQFGDAKTGILPTRQSVTSNFSETISSHITSELAAAQPAPRTEHVENVWVLDNADQNLSRILSAGDFSSCLYVDLLKGNAEIITQNGVATEPVESTRNVNVIPEPSLDSSVEIIHEELVQPTTAVLYPSDSTSSEIVQFVPVTNEVILSDASPNNLIWVLE